MGYEMIEGGLMGLYDLSRVTARLIKRLSKRHGPAPAWSDAAAHAAVLEATVVHYGHAQDERSLSTRSSPSDKPVAGVRIPPSMLGEPFKFVNLHLTESTLEGNTTSLT